MMQIDLPGQCGNDEDGQLCGWQLAGIMEGLDTLYLIFLGIDNAQNTTITTAYQIAHDGATGLVRIVGAANDDDALRFQ